MLRAKTMEAIERRSSSSSSSAAAIEEETPSDSLFYFTPSPPKLPSSSIDSNSFTVFSFDSLHSCLDMMLEDEEELQCAELTYNTTSYFHDDLGKKEKTRVDDLGESFR